MRTTYITWILSVVAIGCNDHGYYNNREGLQPSSFWLQLLSRAWSILDYTGLATLYLTFGRGEGSLMVGVRREEADDHIVYVYGVYIHREYITVTAV